MTRRSEVPKLSLDYSRGNDIPAAKTDQTEAHAPGRRGADRKDWVHEIKYDGYRMHARIDGLDIKLLTRTGLDWSHRYRRTIGRLPP